MKSSVRISSVLLLTAIYCFTIGIVTKPLVYSAIQTTNHEKYFPSISTILFLHTPKTESSVNNFNNFPAPGIKNLYDGLWALTKTTEQFYEAAFTQYTGFSRNFLIQLQKTSIIFPFHYFW